MSVQSTTNCSPPISHYLCLDLPTKIVTNPIVFYDGVCGLCNRLVQFLLKHDKKDRLRFAALQSEFAAKILGRHGIDPTDLDTVHVVVNFDEPNERVLNRSTAVLQATRELGGMWAVVGALGMIVPRPIRNFFYRLVAKNRYRMFGKYETCMLPTPSHRAKFLDLN
jgi:predicted DCC family thiol-disulfide oxidoreductase YuxK